MTESAGSSREKIADHFRARIPELLNAWRSAAARDPTLTTGDALPVAQLEDHLPVWLAAFADVLAAPPGPKQDLADAEQARDAEAHGLQRWQQGYDLREVTREWGCLHRVLVAELEEFAAAHPHFIAGDTAEARLKLAEQISEATSTSAEEYFRLERLEATGSVRDLEGALAELRDLETTRGQLWEQASHDLRGSLGVVANAAEGLRFENLPAQRRLDFLGLLRNNVVALRHLLDDVTGLARLQAGQEQRRVGSFDAAGLLQRLCDDMRLTAEGRGLTLKTEGPGALAVEGDAVKVRRIAQNLLLNALNYTKAGGVTVTWGDCDGEGDGERWMLAVVDTGPGFHAGPGAPLITAIGAATVQSAAATEGGAEALRQAISDVVPDDPRQMLQVQGEGLGLAIVKRLAELLNASIELESVVGQGTTFRILMPRRYPPVPA